MLQDQLLFSDALERFIRRGFLVCTKPKPFVEHIVEIYRQKNGLSDIFLDLLTWIDYIRVAELCLDYISLLRNFRMKLTISTPYFYGRSSIMLPLFPELDRSRRITPWLPWVIVYWLVPGGRRTKKQSDLSNKYESVETDCFADSSQAPSDLWCWCCS